MLPFLALAIVWIVLRFRRQDPPFKAVSSHSKVVSSVIYAALTWLVVLNPIMSLLDKGKPCIRSTEITGVQFHTYDYDHDQFTVSMWNKHLEKSIEASRIYRTIDLRGVTVVPDTTFWNVSDTLNGMHPVMGSHVDTIKNTSTIIEYFNESANSLVYVNVFHQSQFGLVLTKTDYLNIPANHRRDLKAKGTKITFLLPKTPVSRTDSLSIAVDTLSN